MKKIELDIPAANEEAIREGRIEEVIVLEHGRPVALITPFDEDDLEWYTRERDPQFIESISRAREQAKSGDFLAQVELKKQLGLP